MTENNKKELYCPTEVFEPYQKRLKDLYEDMDKQYNAAAAYYSFECKGCEDNCCLSRFYHHTVVEYLYFMEGFNRLEKQRQIEIKERAYEFDKKHFEADRGEIAVRIMCPVNFDGLCGLYEFRPMICRLHGIPYELKIPEKNLIYGKGCDEFTRNNKSKSYYKFDRTRFYSNMAALERELRKNLCVTDKFKMTIAQMLL